MKRTDVIRAIRQAGAEFVREGGSHTLYRNPFTGLIFAVPRHTEIAPGTARSIIRDALRRP